MTPPIRSNTLDAMQDAQAAQARVRAALESELVYLYEQIDRLRAEVDTLRAEQPLPKKRRAPRARGNIARMISAELDAGVTDE